MYILVFCFLIHTLPLAKYVSENWGHFRLNIPTRGMWLFSFAILTILTSSYLFAPFIFLFLVESIDILCAISIYLGFITSWKSLHIEFLVSLYIFALGCIFVVFSNKYLVWLLVFIIVTPVENFIDMAVQHGKIRTKVKVHIEDDC